MCRPRPETSDQTLYAQRPVLVGVDGSDIGLATIDVPTCEAVLLVTRRSPGAGSSARRRW
jgi:hypothetical protein